MPSDAQLPPTTFSGTNNTNTMESDSSIQQQLESSMPSSSVTADSEVTLIPPLCSRPPEGNDEDDHTLNFIESVKNSQPCHETSSNSNASTPIKTHQVSLEELMVNKNDKDVVQKPAHSKIMPKDSNENIAKLPDLHTRIPEELSTQVSVSSF